jgi:hypothetical protein
MTEEIRIKYIEPVRDICSSQISHGRTIKNASDSTETYAKNSVMPFLLKDLDAIRRIPGIKNIKIDIIVLLIEMLLQA